MPEQRRSEALLTDLYQLTMLDAYRRAGMAGPAVFELFTRRLPPGRNFLLAAGLEQALSFLENLHFTTDDLDWLAATGRFATDFTDALAGFRFTGDVWALPEGTPFFADEPVLRVAAPLPEAQLVESRLMNIVHFQTLIASKAARCVLAAGGRRLVDFGMRRAHEADAALYAARAAWVAGFDGTATVLAGRHFDIPLYGTMAHSFVQAYDSEARAFEAFAAARPQGLVLLIDTYDVRRAIGRVIALQAKLDPLGQKVAAVRLDSGDLGAGAKLIRRLLDAAGLQHVEVFLSGNLDEHAIATLCAAGVPAMGFGVGTSLDTSADAPSIDFAYKLQCYDGRPRRKRSVGKATWPGAKQVYRRYSGAAMAGDQIVEHGEAGEGEPLLVKVMENGARTTAPESLAAIRERTRAALASLPVPLRRLETGAPYAVGISDRLRALAREADAATAG